MTPPLGALDRHPEGCVGFRDLSVIILAIGWNYKLLHNVSSSSVIRWEITVGVTDLYIQIIACNECYV